MNAMTSLEDDLHICPNCEMLFPNPAQLGRHLHKFCVRSQLAQEVLQQETEKSRQEKRRKPCEEQLLRMKEEKLKDDLFMHQDALKQMGRTFSQQKNQLKKDILDEILFEAEEQRKYYEDRLQWKEQQFLKQQNQRPPKSTKKEVPIAPQVAPQIVQQQPISPANGIQDQRGYANDRIRELEGIKENYLDNGGKDPAFLDHLERLYLFYDEMRNNAGLKVQDLRRREPTLGRPMPIQPSVETKPTTRSSFRSEQSVAPRQRTATQPKQLQEDPLIQRGERIERNIRQLNMQQVELQHLDRRVQQQKERERFKGKFEELRPDKAPLMLARPYNESKNREEKMMEEIMREEVDELRMLKGLQGTRLYQQAFANYKHRAMMREELEKETMALAANRVIQEIEQHGKDEGREEANMEWVGIQRKRMIELQELRQLS